MGRLSAAEIKKHLMANWYFPVSAMAFFCISIDNTLAYCLGMVVAFAAMVIIAARVPSVWALVRGKGRAMTLFCLFSALGICLGNQEQFLRRAMQLNLPEHMNIYLIALSYFGAAAAFCFVYICLVLFWQKLIAICRENGIFRGITRGEWALYGALALGSMLFAAWAFSRSQMFYGTEYNYDLIYTSDSPALIKGGVYHFLTHKQNDIRQPLFSVFAAPFVGIPLLLGRLPGMTASLRAILLNCSQIALLFAANVILTRIMDLEPGKRMCVMGILCFSYTQLLFILMMEQYIVAYFWLVLCVFLITRGRVEPVVLWGAGGTLLTSAVLMPFLSAHHPVRAFKAWFLDMLKLGFGFLGAILVWSRFDVLFLAVEQLVYLDQFTGHTVTMLDKICQFTAFVPACFTGPRTRIIEMGWYLQEVTALNYAGIALFVLAVVSGILNRKHRGSQLALFWVAFSAVMLVGLGWGTAENGLILYALYFGWAYLALIFRLVENIAQWLKLRYLVSAVGIACAVGFAVVNIPQIMDLVRFAIAMHPV